MREFEMCTVSSLEKVMPSGKIQLTEKENIMMKNEVFSFQIAMCVHDDIALYSKIVLKSDINNVIEMRIVDLAPCTTPVRPGYDDYQLTDYATMIPDILRPIDDFNIDLRCDQWKSVWVTIRGNYSVPVGNHKLHFTIYDEFDIELGHIEYVINVLNMNLPKQTLIYTDWFHCDSICNYYNVEMFSEDFYKYFRSYVSLAVNHGMNLLLTPIFTPPIDTERGKERLTAQLVDVFINKGEYTFGYDKFDRFIDEATKCGIKYFEMAHLFTQWGAVFAPKIIAEVDGKKMKIFGWETASDSNEYTAFIKAFLTDFTAYLTLKGMTDNVYFHTSDEPRMNNIEYYKKAHKLMDKYVGNFPIIDALSHVDLYNEGVIAHPIPDTGSVTEFIRAGVPDLWVYYCCTEYRNYLSNRFMNLPSQRNRIIGVQLYLNNIKGFLHWGYNFYQSHLSKKNINPFIVNDGMGIFQSGDAFIVYPSKDGAWDSLRHEVFYDALQDMRSLQMLEEKIGRKSVEDFLLSEGMGYGFNNYPHSAVWHIELRRKIYNKLK